MTELPNHSVSRTRIKICGITRREDALAAIAAGADALGFVFYPPSSRALSIDAAKAVMYDLPPFIAKVALFLDADEDEVNKHLEELPIDLLQFHGQETAEFCGKFSKTYIKALGSDSSNQLLEIGSKYSSASALLLDSHNTGEAGGTGETFDWTKLPEKFNQPIILAGGLRPDNVAQAVRQVQPFAVDVSSGVESSPGHKDSELINQFVAQVRRADSERNDI